MLIKAKRPRHPENFLSFGFEFPGLTYCACDMEFGRVFVQLARPFCQICCVIFLCFWDNQYHIPGTSQQPMLAQTLVNVGNSYEWIRQRELLRLGWILNLVLGSPKSMTSATLTPLVRNVLASSKLKMKLKVEFCSMINKRVYAYSPV